VPVVGGATDGTDAKDGTGSRSLATISEFMQATRLLRSLSFGEKSKSDWVVGCLQFRSVLFTLFRVDLRCGRYDSLAASL